MLLRPLIFGDAQVLKCIDVGCGNNFFLKQLQANSEAVGIVLRGIGGEPRFHENASANIDFFSGRVSRIIRHKMDFYDFNIDVGESLDVVCVNSPHPFDFKSISKVGAEALLHLKKGGIFYVGHSQIDFIPSEIDGYEKVDEGRFDYGGYGSAPHGKATIRFLKNLGSPFILQTPQPIQVPFGSEEDTVGITFPGSPTINSNAYIMYRKRSGEEVRTSLVSYCYSDGCIPGYKVFKKIG